MQPAPEIRDIYWPNISTPAANSNFALGRIIANIIAALLCLFWAIPVAFVSSLASISVGLFALFSTAETSNDFVLCLLTDSGEYLWLLFPQALARFS